MKMGTVDVVILTLSNNITFLGKTWWILMVFLRLLVLLSGFTLFGGDEEGFVCNTIQPGCVSVCFDVFTPISLFRFLWFQLLVLSLPHAAFLVYVAHRALSSDGLGPYYRLWDGGRQTSGSSSTLQHQSAQSSLSKAPLQTAPLGGWSAPNFRCAYFLDLILRVWLEAAFITGQFYLYGLSVPRGFLCNEAPCFSGVACYVSRATEKTLLLNFALGVAALSLLLSLVDFACSLKGTSARRKREMLDEELRRGEQSGVFMGNGGLEDTEVLLTRTTPDVGCTRGGVNAGGTVPSKHNGVANGIPVLPHPKMSHESLVEGASAQGKAPEFGEGAAMGAVPRLPVLAGTLGHGRYVMHSQLKPPLSPRSAGGAGPRPGVYASPAKPRRVDRYSPVTGSDPQSDSSETPDRGAYV